MPPPLTVVGFAGSLRAGSYNRALLAAAVELAPEGVALDVHTLDDVPFYNGDLDRDGVRPAAVERLRAAVAEADGVLIATPEYNYGVPGVLVNALDWLSRPALASPMAYQPAGVLSASPGAIGGARAQLALKATLQTLGALVMPHPGVVVGHAAQKFDAEGRLVDEPTRQFLAGYLRDLQAWTHRVGQPVLQAA